MMINNIPERVGWALMKAAKKEGCTIDELANRILSNYLVGKGYLRIY